VTAEKVKKPETEEKDNLLKVYDPEIHLWVKDTVAPPMPVFETAALTETTVQDHGEKISNLNLDEDTETL